MTEAQWREVLDLCREKKFIPVLDIAYQGYATGDLVRDSFSTRLFCEANLEFFVSQSFAKNLGLYGERIGMLHIVSLVPSLSLFRGFSSLRPLLLSCRSHLTRYSRVSLLCHRLLMSLCFSLLSACWPAAALLSPCLLFGV